MKMQDKIVLAMVAVAFHPNAEWDDRLHFAYDGIALCAQMMHFMHDDPIGAKQGETWLIIYYTNGNRGWFAVRGGEVQLVSADCKDAGE